MKRKNLVLGLIAFTLAITGAFATAMFAPVSVFVRAKVSSTSTTFTCEPCGVTCNDPNTQLCRVQVMTTSMGAKIVQGRRQGDCQVLTHTTAAVQNCTAQYFDVQ